MRLFHDTKDKKQTEGASIQFYNTGKIQDRKLSLRRLLQPTSRSVLPWQRCSDAKGGYFEGDSNMFVI